MAAAVLILAQARAAPPKEADPVFAPYAVQVEQAVDRALGYLRREMNKDGTFDGEFGKSPAIMGLAGMAFLAAGHTPRDASPEGQAIVTLIEAILPKQEKNGWLGTEGGRMYGHCIATLFLSEVSGMVDPELEKKTGEALAKAVQLIISAQQIRKEPRFQGGWRYDAQSKDSDTSVSGWAIMALRSARLNGAPVPEYVIRDANQYLMNHCDEKEARFGYENKDDHPVNMTGVALLCLELSGFHGKPITTRAGDYLLKTFREDLERGHYREYGTYYIAQAMFQLGGTHWETYARWMYDHWLPQQRDDGSWIVRQDVCPAYFTAMTVLSLTVPYRQLPIYQRDETVDEF